MSPFWRLEFEVIPKFLENLCTLDTQGMEIMTNGLSRNYLPCHKENIGYSWLRLQYFKLDLFCLVLQYCNRIRL